MDKYNTPLGELTVGWLGHGSLLLEWNGRAIYVDPYAEAADYRGRRPADLVLITHSHYDHYDPQALACIVTPDTQFIVSRDVAPADARWRVLENGRETEWNGLTVRAVPSYNIHRRNEEGHLFHAPGDGNGYLLDFGGFRCYMAGDTEPVPEMDALPHCNVAFLPKNLPYTMTDSEFAALADRLKPDVLYPIHFFELDYAALRARINPQIRLINPEKI